jgi:hypothetical protein
MRRAAALDCSYAELLAVGIAMHLACFVCRRVAYLPRAICRRSLRGGYGDTLDGVVGASAAESAGAAPTANPHAALTATPAPAAYSC